MEKLCIRSTSYRSNSNQRVYQKTRAACAYNENTCVTRRRQEEGYTLRAAGGSYIYTRYRYDDAGRPCG